MVVVNAAEGEPGSAKDRVLLEALPHLVLDGATLVQNVETLAHLALVARHGPQWFRQLGVPEDPGSLLITLAGAVLHPAVYEVEHGIQLGELLRQAGSATGEIRAFLIGGYFGTWVPADSVGTRLTEQDLAAHGAALGSGVVVALPTSACPVAEVVRVSAYLADQSARQCGPCLHGLASVAQAVAALASGRPWRGSQLQLLRWLSDIEDRGACHHLDLCREMAELCPPEALLLEYDRERGESSSTG